MEVYMSKNGCCCSGVSLNEQKLLEVIEKHKNEKSELIPILHEAQEIFGHLPIEVQKTISENTGIPLTEIYGVVTFYTQFSLEPKGRYKVQVCLGTACYVKGAGEIHDKFKEILGIDTGECTEDKMFSLDACRCIGACGLAPVVMINDDVYGNLKPDDVHDIVEKYVKMGAGGEQDEDSR
jgi:NADP-reducing hydrogenase subunit HndA